MQKQRSVSQLLQELEALKEKNTEMQRVKEQHLRSRQILKKVKREAQQYLDIAGVIIVVIEQNGSISLINKKGCEILGYEEHELIGKNWFDTFIPQEEREKVWSVFKSLIENGEMPAEYAENYVLSKNGKKKLIAWHNTLIRDEAGEVQATLSSGEDITERKEFEIRLRSSEAKYRALVDNALVGFYKTNLNGDVLYVNDAIVNILEYDSKHELMQNSALAAYENPQDRARFLDSLIEKGKVDEYEFEAVTKTGKTKTILISAILENDTISGMFMDITDRKQLERKKEQDSKKQKMEELGTLAEKVAHDFSSLLEHIQNSAERAAESLDEQHPSYNFIRILQTDVSRAASLTQQLLLCSGKQRGALALIDINDVVEKNLEAVQEIVGSDIEVQTALSEDVWKIFGEKEEIELIILNFAVNAREAMPNGGIMRLGVENVIMDEAMCKDSPEWRAGRFVCLYVFDEGSVVDDEVMPRIFDPYFTNGEEGRRAGLGLSVVYGIAKQHEGWVDIISPPEGGSTFKIFLPAAELKR